MGNALQTAGTARDFDYFMGSWRVHNRRLRTRLAGSDEWDEFEATVVARPLLDGVEGRPILVRLLWSRATTKTPRWEQAFSEDGGETWETNWVMDFTPS